MELSISITEPITGEHPVVKAGHGFARFYAQHHGDIARALSLTLGDNELGGEATDEAMTRACQRWGDVSTYRNPEGWVYRVGLNWARSFLRRRRRMRSSIHLEDVGVHDPPPPDPRLAAALQQLDPKHRSVVVLRYYLDWSIDDTAEALGIASGTVKSRLNRALHQLQRLLASSEAADQNRPAPSPVIDLRSTPTGRRHEQRARP